MKKRLLSLYWFLFSKLGKADAQHLLRYAAHLIEVHGWGQGSFVDSKGRYCAVGALNRASVDLHAPHELYRKAHTLLAQCVVKEQYLGSIAGWNDQSVRKASDVINGLRHAAKGC